LFRPGSTESLRTRPSSVARTGHDLTGYDVTGTFLRDASAKWGCQMRRQVGKSGRKKGN
jgi:hypothetical protein